MSKAVKSPGWFDRLPQAWKWSLPVWLAARVFYSSWGALLWSQGLTYTNLAGRFYHEVQPLLQGAEGALLGVWQRWDAIHYIRIARNGYDAVELTAFFPLYPWLGGLLSRLTGLETTAALLITSSLAFLLALVLLYQIVDEVFPERRPGLARGTIIAAALFPTSVFFLAPYPHSLALLLVLISYQSARRHRWLSAFIASFAAALTHSTVLPLVFLLGVEALRWTRSSAARLKWMSFLPVLGPALGAGLFLAWRIRQGFPSLLALQAQEWNRTSQWPWQAFINLPALIRSESFAVSGWLNLVLLILAAGLLIWNIRRFPVGETLYLAALLVILLSMKDQEPSSSFPRYLLMAFPLFTALAMAARRRLARLGLVFVGLLAALYTSALFFMWVWVA